MSDSCHFKTQVVKGVETVILSKVRYIPLPLSEAPQHFTSEHGKHELEIFFWTGLATL